MDYNTYQDAYDALVKDNDGVLPDLDELANLTISCHPSNLPAVSTVADVVAYALVEVSALAPATPPRPTEKVLALAGVTASASPVVNLDELLLRAAGTLN